MYSSFYLPTISPIILEIYGPLAIRWYSVAYLMGFFFGIYYSKKLVRRFQLPITIKNIDDFFSYLVISVIVGGRLGYVFFYDFSHFIQYPIDILKTYEGGMSFHGGVLGCVIAIMSFCYLHKLKFMQITDLIVLSAPFGIMLGRIANFINGEHFGKPTDAIWGVYFTLGGSVLRHPSQLYEAFMEGLLPLIILNYFALGKNKLTQTGFITGLWGVLYALGRGVCEIFREPDGIINIGFEVTIGQALSIPLLIMGIFFINLSYKNKQISK